MDRIPESDDIQCFNQWAGTYENSLVQFFIDRLHRDVLDLLGKKTAGKIPGTLADIGCGTGRLLRNAAKRWPAANLIGVDHSPGMLEVARRLTPAGVFYVGSAGALPLPDNSVDAALSTLSIHHWDEPLTGMREIVRILRPGGYFCLADIKGSGFLSILFNHFKGNRPETWNALFNQAGMTVLALENSLAGFASMMIGEKGSPPHET
jgi:ubiquinone/menaquinone biosynthesis C-methylase UbiE